MNNNAESFKVNSNNLNLEKIQLVIENMRLLDENIKLFLLNKKLMDRIGETREFEKVLSEECHIKDCYSLEQKVKKFEVILKEVSAFCPAGYKHEIERLLGVKE